MRLRIKCNKCGNFTEIEHTIGQEEEPIICLSCGEILDDGNRSDSFVTGSDI